MSHSISTSIHPSILKIQGLLRKIDHLQLPALSRRDVENILAGQISEELDDALPSKRGHGRRTATLAVALGNIAGLSAETLHTLKLASLLHDIGLLTLQPHQRSVRTRLDNETHVAEQCHSRIGAELLEPFQFLRDAAVLIAHHHERWDGSGYPYGIRGAFIPVGARILSIADAFDAIDVPGVRCPTVRSRIAYRILRVAAGTQFDPSLVELFGQQLVFKSTKPLIDLTPPLLVLTNRGNCHES